jgi:anti-sigma factor RsiW
MDTKTGCVTEEEINAQLDGDLAPERLGEISAHLQTCASCQALADEIDAVRSGLRTHMQARLRRNLWSDIKRRMYPTGNRRHQTIHRWHLWWALPAAAMSGAAAALLLIWLSWGSGPSRLHEPAGPAGALSSVLQAEQIYQETIASLEVALAHQASSVNPQVREEMERSLANIEKTIKRCRAMVRNDPRNLETHRTVLVAYQYKVDFLRELVERTLMD